MILGDGDSGLEISAVDTILPSDDWEEQLKSENCYFCNSKLYQRISKLWLHLTRRKHSQCLQKYLQRYPEVAALISARVAACTTPVVGKRARSKDESDDSGEESEGEDAGHTFGSTARAGGGHGEEMELSTGSNEHDGRSSPSDGDEEGVGEERRYGGGLILGLGESGLRSGSGSEYSASDEDENRSDGGGSSRGGERDGNWGEGWGSEEGQDEGEGEGEEGKEEEQENQEEKAPDQHGQYREGGAFQDQLQLGEEHEHCTLQQLIQDREYELDKQIPPGYKAEVGMCSSVSGPSPIFVYELLILCNICLCSYICLSTHTQVRTGSASHAL
jgi:hypothetical protein